MGVPLEMIKVGLKVKWCVDDGQSFIGVLKRIEDVDLGSLCHFLWDCYDAENILTSQVNASYYMETVNRHSEMRPMNTTKTFEDLL